MGEHLWNKKIKITMESCCEVQVLSLTQHILVHMGDGLHDLY